MPFGKHKGKSLTDIPIDYLVWLVNECDLKESLRVAVEKELRRREFAHSPEPTGKTTSLSTDVVHSWYRKLSMEFHPDRRGGNHEGMKAINRAKELLLGMLESVA